MTAREKSRIVVPTVLLFILAMFIMAREWKDGRGDGGAVEGIPVRAERTNSAPAGETPRGDEVPAPGRLPVLEANRPPDPFDPSLGADVLSRVRDAGIVAPGEPEDAGLMFLFHRIRAGVELPVDDSPIEFEDWFARAEELRGTRHRIFGTLIEEPIPRDLPENPSGVLRYWEAFAQSPDGHLLRVNFIEKPPVLPADTEVEFVADFLRLHRYQPVRGGEGAVPDWVAGGVEVYTPPPREEGQWRPLLWVALISMCAIVPLLWGAMREGRPTGRRTARHKSPAARPPSPAKDGDSASSSGETPGDPPSGGTSAPDSP